VLVQVQVLVLEQVLNNNNNPIHLLPWAEWAAWVEWEDSVE
jgi:hypothetical protein